MDNSCIMETVRCQQKLPKLNTVRLKPVRQVTRSTVLNILETGHVSIEFFKRRGGDVRVAEIFVVSGDGNEICLQDLFSDVPAADQSLQFFTYDNLPEKHWKKYAMACRVVDLTKSKTAKVTMYSERAKGALMENIPPSFEASFYNGGPRVTIREKELEISESENGPSHRLQLDRLGDFVSQYTLDLIQHAKQILEQCLRLEASISRLQGTSSDVEHLFPVTVGIRPSSFCSSTSSLSDQSFGPLHGSPNDGSFLGRQSSPEPLPNIHEPFQNVMETPRSVVPLPHPSPASPLRHLSTLNGRQDRCKMSSSVRGSALQDESFCQLESIESGHALVSSSVFDDQLDWNQHVVTSTPCPATKAWPHLPLVTSERSHHESFQEPRAQIVEECKDPISKADIREMHSSVSAPEFDVASASLMAARMVQLQQRQLHNVPLNVTCSDGQLNRYVPDSCNLTCSQRPSDICNSFGAENKTGTKASSQTDPAFSSLMSCDTQTRTQTTASSHVKSYPSTVPPSPSKKVDVSSSRPACNKVVSANVAACDCASHIATSYLSSSSPAAQIPHTSFSRSSDAKNGQLLDPPSAVRQTFVRYTGWVTQLSNGIIWIRYNEGTQLAINPQVSGPLELLYIDQKGQRFVYQQSDSNIPVYVRLKLERLPDILKYLQNSSADCLPAGLV